MQSHSTSTSDAFRDSAKSFLADMGGPARVRRLRDATPGFEHSVWHAIAEAGWTSILVPEDEGGLGLGVRELLAVVEDVAERYGLIAISPISSENEIWLCQLRHEEDVSGLLMLKENSPAWHRRRAWLCGVPDQDVDEQFHLRAGHGKRCD